MPSNSSVRFPNETAAYRDAREALLTAEMVPEDYEFDEIVVGSC